MRLMILGLIATLSVPATTSSQTFSNQWPGPSRDPLPTFAIPPLFTGRPTGLPPPHIGAPLPSIGLPLPSIGLPLPSIGLQPPIDRHGSVRHHRGSTFPVWPVMVFLMPQPAAPIVPPRGPEPPLSEQRSTKGSLVLEVRPGSTQVFVDGYYVGVADDFTTDRRSLLLDVGAHTVELNEPEHETVSFDVKIASNAPIVYRRVLTRVNTAPPPTTPILPPLGPVYLIPGCYLGNVPPKDAGLPPTCDPARTVRLN